MSAVSRFASDAMYSDASLLRCCPLSFRSAALTSISVVVIIGLEGPVPAVFLVASDRNNEKVGQRKRRALTTVSTTTHEDTLRPCRWVFMDPTMLLRDVLNLHSLSAYLEAENVSKPSFRGFSFKNAPVDTSNH